MDGVDYGRLGADSNYKHDPDSDELHGQLDFRVVSIRDCSVPFRLCGDTSWIHIRGGSEQTSYSLDLRQGDYHFPNPVVSIHYTFLTGDLLRPIFSAPF